MVGSAAFERINEAIPSARGIIAGKGSKREELRFIAEQEGLENVVSFPGYVDNPYGYMGGADVFMLSSEYEGLPTVLIEALSSGCPIASTDCPRVDASKACTLASSDRTASSWLRGRV